MLLIVFLVSLYRPTSYLSLRIYDGGLIFRAASSKSYSPSQQITPSLLPTSNSSLRSSTPTSTIKDLSVFRSSKTENGNQVRESRPLLKQSWACLWIRIRMIHLLLLLLRLIRMIGTPPPPKNELSALSLGSGSGGWKLSRTWFGYMRFEFGFGWQFV